MAKLVRNLALLAGAAAAARRYAQKNPDQAGKLVDQAAGFVDKQTKGRYRSQIEGAARTAKGAAGIQHAPGQAAAGPYGGPTSYSPGSAQPNGQTWTDATSQPPPAPQAPGTPPGPQQG
ncbi:MAG: antitoxin [Pseudonocardia sp.]